MSTIDNKKIPKLLVALVSGVVVLFFIVLVIVMSVKSHVSLSEIKSDEDAKKVMEKLMENIKIHKGSPAKASVSFETNLAQELPEITQYPLTVEGYGDVDIEIFATSEKSGSDKDGWINDIALKFNKEGYTTSTGKTMSVSIRPMASGMGSDYIISGKYLPQGYTPSNYLYGALIQAQGGDVKIVSEKLVGNCAGILLSDDMYDKLKDKYGEASLAAVVKATADNNMTMGYTNPLSSATGLNFLVTTLKYYDSENILSDKAKEGFTSFQTNVPYVAYTTLQMRTSAKSGSFDGMVMEYQSYINDDDLSSEYKFIPFGIKHDNPLYSVGTLNKDQQEAMQKFVEYCESSTAQKLATSYGFNQDDAYGNSGDDKDAKYTGADLIGAQKIWKNNKDGGKDVCAVFVADVSGSMQGAVESLSANGNTASYDALVVALDMILKEKEDNPDIKPMIFLLSDGAANEGNEIDDIKGIFQYYQIPIYTISYGSNADKKAMEEVSMINEAATINASSDDVVYKIKSLFNAQM